LSKVTRQNVGDSTVNRRWAGVKSSLKGITRP
jgi:hypothetical protein